MRESGAMLIVAYSVHSCMPYGERSASHLMEEIDLW